MDQVLRHIDEKEIIELACNLVNLPSRTGNERPVGEFVRDWLQRLGIKAGLEAHGGRLEDIVMTNLYFTDRKTQWPIYDRIRREMLPRDPPTSTGVGVTELDLGAAMEVTVIAAVARDD